MKFPKLHIENFLAISEADVNLADRGLVLIQGKNSVDTSAQSNGAGKSSIADALCWAWFGTTARGVTGDDVINFDAKKNTKVVSTLMDAGVLYTVTRYRKHKTGKNGLTITMHDGLKETDLTKGTDKLTQEVADQIIGASQEVFAGSIYAGQEKMPDLPAMTDKALKMLIEEAAGVLVLEAAYKKAREDYAVAAGDAGAAEIELARGRQTSERITAQITQSNIDMVSWQVDQDAEIERLKSEVGWTVMPELRAIIAQIAAIDPAVIDAGIAAADAEIASVAGQNATMIGLERNVSLNTGAELTARRSFEATFSAMERTAKEVLAVAHKLGCPCTECGRPLTAAELAAATKAAADRETNAVLAHADADKELALAVISLGEAIKARDAFKLGLVDISAASAARAAHAAARASYDALVTSRDVLTNSARGYKDRIVKAMAAVNPHAATLTRLEKDLAANETEIVSIAKTHKDLVETLAVEAEVVKIFSPAGVRARILDDVTPFLNTQTAKYLGTLSDDNIEAVWTTLTPNAKGVLTEKFTIDVTNAHGAKIFKGLSGGEKRKVRVATALALQDLVATRATKPIELFIGDEIDDALDPAGIERLMTVLEEKAVERGSVFIISHNELADFCNNVMVIEKTLSGTSITETTI